MIRTQSDEEVTDPWHEKNRSSTSYSEEEYVNIFTLGLTFIPFRALTLTTY